MQAYMRATLRSGETFIRSDNTAVTISCASSTRATYSMSNRAFYFEGLLVQNVNYPIVPSGFIPVLVGDYLKRKKDENTYMVETLQIQPRSPGQDYVYLSMCNHTVTLARPKPDLVGSTNGVLTFDTYQEKVLVFMDITTRSYKEQKDGMLGQEITILHIPSRYGVQKMDRIYLRKGETPLEECRYYRVDSINDALSHSGATFEEGMDIIQLSDDRRADKQENGFVGPIEAGW